MGDYKFLDEQLATFGAPRMFTNRGNCWSWKRTFAKIEVSQSQQMQTQRLVSIDQ